MQRMSPKVPAVFCISHLCCQTPESPSEVRVPTADPSVQQWHFGGNLSHPSYSYPIPLRILMQPAAGKDIKDSLSTAENGKLFGKLKKFGKILGKIGNSSDFCPSFKNRSQKHSQLLFTASIFWLSGSRIVDSSVQTVHSVANSASLLLLPNPPQPNDRHFRQFFFNCIIFFATFKNDFAESTVKSNCTHENAENIYLFYF